MQDRLKEIERQAENSQGAIAFPHLLKYEHDPIGFIQNELKTTLTEEQRAIALSVLNNQETNVQASHGIGKTKVAADLALWHVLCRNGLAITTAPTRRQVQELLWSEIRRSHSSAHLPGELTLTTFKVSEDARAYGFTANHYNSNAFQGIHHDRLLVIEDEACGISAEIDEGAEACVTGSNNRILRIGNPIQKGGPFEKACKRSHIRVPVWNHPNVAWAYEVKNGIHCLKPEVAALILDDQGNVLPQHQWKGTFQDQIPGAVSIGWIEKVRSKYGEGSPYWLSRVEGLFPDSYGQSIIPQSLFLKCRSLYDEDPTRWDTLANKQLSRYGLDVGDGGDPHGLARWQGPVLYSAQSIAGFGDERDVSRAAGLAIAAIRDNPGTVAVDRAGVGAGALSILLDDGFDANGVHWGSSPNDSDQFLNLKIEDWWTLREAMAAGEVAIAPLGDSEDEAMEDLSAVAWEVSRTGKTQAEAKEKTKKKLGRSPNTGDAIVIGFRFPVSLAAAGSGSNTIRPSRTTARVI